MIYPSLSYLPLLPIQQDPRDLSPFVYYSLCTGAFLYIRFSYSFLLISNKFLLFKFTALATVHGGTGKDAIS